MTPGPASRWPALARGADLLLSEASFITGKDTAVDLHLTGREAGLLATRAGVGRLVVTHVPPWQDRSVVLAEVESAYQGAVSMAEPGAVYEL